MFDIGFFELLLIGVVGLLVLGPERLPRAARMAGLWMRRARATWYSVRSELERELADEDLKTSLKREAGELNRLGQSIAAEGKSLSSSLAAVAAPLTEGSSLSAGSTPEASRDEPNTIEQSSTRQQASGAEDDVSAEDERAMREPLMVEQSQDETEPALEKERNLGSTPPATPPSERTARR